MQKLIEGQQKHWEKHGYGNWGIVLLGRSEITGWAGPQFLPETGETDVGYLLDRSYWGRGYATEAAWASLQFAFAQFDFEQQLETAPTGAPSRPSATACPGG